MLQSVLKFHRISVKYLSYAQRILTAHKGINSGPLGNIKLVNALPNTNLVRASSAIKNNLSELITK